MATERNGTERNGTERNGTLELFADENNVKHYFNYLMVDTALFNVDFKAKLLKAVDNLDDVVDGVLVHGDNFQGLSLLQERYKEQVKCIYIDPPYNTGNENTFLYKDAYQSSSWASLMLDRLQIAIKVASEKGGIWVSTDDGEYANLKHIMSAAFGADNFVADIVWNSRKSVSNDALISSAINHTTFFAFNKKIMDANKQTFRLPQTEEGFTNPDNDPRGAWKLDPMDAPNIRLNLSYEIINSQTGDVFLPPKGRCWRFEQWQTEKYMVEGRILFGRTGNGRPAFKRFLSEAQDKGRVTTTLWTDVDTTTEATKLLLGLFGETLERETIDRACKLNCVNV